MSKVYIYDKFLGNNGSYKRRQSQIDTSLYLSVWLKQTCQNSNGYWSNKNILSDKYETIFSCV